MELIFAFVFSCLVQFKSCTYTVNPKPFKEVAACVAQANDDRIAAERAGPASFNDPAYPTYVYFSFCAPAFRYKVPS
jgi:hypothetical protein